MQSIYNCIGYRIYNKINSMSFLPIYPNLSYAQYFPFFNYIPHPFIQTNQSEVKIQEEQSIAVAVQSSNTKPEQQTKTQTSRLYKKEKIILTAQDLEKISTKDKQHRPWTEDEDELLLDLRDKQGMDWQQICKLIKNRTMKMCYNRYNRIQATNRYRWSKQTDDKIIYLVEQLNYNWKQIAKEIKDRNYRQIEERYLNYLRPGLKNAQWTTQEDLILIKLLKVYGRNWKIIEQNMNGRSSIQIRNRFHGVIKKLNDQKLTLIK